jgi:outer membrane protein OmpA-like peptidoglycan-associated protein/tetratricopeptide (TPR) repeat protein
MRVILALLFSFITITTFAQTAVEKGDQYYEFFQYKEASRAYEEALKKERTFKNEAHILTNLAYCYLYTFQYGKAEEVFAQLVKLGDRKPLPEVYLDYGNVLKILGNYEKAKEQFVYYGTLLQKDEYAKFLDRSLNWAIKNKELINPNVYVGVTNLDVSGQSLGYTLFEDGIVFAQAKDTNYSEFTTLFDLRFAHQTDSVHFSPANEYVASITFPYNEGSPCISADGQTLYFTATAAKVKKGKVTTSTETSDDGVSNLKVYSATLSNGEFGDVVELPFNNKEYNNLNPFITADGNMLYFVSDMPGGYGGLDIYKCTKLADGRWSSPINLGDRVNTSEHESYPFMLGNDLYFASKGHVGFGGYDLFKCTIGVNSTISVAQNLGKPFNSSKDDVALIFMKDGVSGYLSSNRDNVEGFDKVYYFNSKYTAPAVAQVVAPVKDTASKVVALVKSGREGTALPKEKKTETTTVVSTPIATQLEKPATQHVFYEFNSTQVSKADLALLDAVAAYWKQNKRTFIDLRAHTDCRGSAAYNYALATKRAKVLFNHLVKLGVNKNYIMITAIGENESLKECETCEACTDEQHAKNRRVDVVAK